MKTREYRSKHIDSETYKGLEYQLDTTKPNQVKLVYTNSYNETISINVFVNELRKVLEVAEKEFGY